MASPLATLVAAIRPESNPLSKARSAEEAGAALLKQIGVDEEELTPIEPNKTLIARGWRAFTEFPRQFRRSVIFWTTEASAAKCAYDGVGLDTPPDGRNKDFAMSDAGQHLRVQAKLRELIERASSAADANLHRGLKPYPLGFAIRADGSRFVFEPVNIEDNDSVVALIRTSFLQHHVICYVLTLGAISEGKQYVLFSAEDESGPMMVGHREIILNPTPYLGPLEIIEGNFAEGRFVGLLPRQVPHGLHQ